MNSEEARKILSACPGEHARGDPKMAEALEQARRDPELFAWFREQAAFDAAIRQKLAQHPVPEGLIEQLLARKRAARRRRYLQSWALAAAVAFLFSLAYLAVSHLKPSPTGEFAAWRADMAQFLVQFPALDLETEAWTEIESWLRDKPFLSRASIPARLQKYPGLGCREVFWRDKRIMLVCFVAEGEVIHLFVLPGAELENAPVHSIPELGRFKRWSTASWSDGGTSYVVLTRGSRGLLERLLAVPARG